MRYIKETVVSLLLLAPMVSIAGAQSLPTKKEAELLLQKAGEAADLRASDTPPFHLVAAVHYTIERQSFEGRYELLWASPERYRENFKMNIAESAEIALADKLYILRNAPALPFPLWSVRQSLKSAKGYLTAAQKNVKRVYSTRNGNDRQACVDSHKDFAQTLTCVDATTNQVVSLRYGLLPPETRGFVRTKEIKQLFGIEFSEFANLGEKRFPLRITRHMQDEKLEVDIDTLNEVRSFAESVFTPLPGTEPLDWCSNPVSDGSVQFDSRSIIQLRAPGNLFAYYVLIGRDGRVEKLVPVRPGGSFVDREMTARLREAKFPIQSCGGKPIEYEMVIDAPTRIRIPQ